MATKIFVNLPVKDLRKSVEFFTKLGYTFNPQFTDENATCMIIGENLFVMLLVSKARAAGGKVPRQAQDHGFMYAHGYEDLDGHTWELVHMTGAPPQ